MLRDFSPPPDQVVFQEEPINWGPLAAAALLVTAPVLVLAMTVQRHIITGLAAGGLKG